MIKSKKNHQIHLWSKNAWRSGISLFKSILALCFSDIPMCWEGNFFSHNYYVCNKILTLFHIVRIPICQQHNFFQNYYVFNDIITLFHIVTTSFPPQINKLNFEYCSCFDMFYYPTFLINQNVCTDLRYRLRLFKI